jgi:hypothetical protein
MEGTSESPSSWARKPIQQKPGSAGEWKEGGKPPDRWPRPRQNELPLRCRETAAGNAAPACTEPELPLRRCAASREALNIKASQFRSSRTRVPLWVIRDLHHAPNTANCPIRMAHDTPRSAARQAQGGRWLARMDRERTGVLGSHPGPRPALPRVQPRAVITPPRAHAPGGDHLSWLASRQPGASPWSCGGPRTNAATLGQPRRCVWR